MLALCLAAVFALTATTLVVASPALAGGCNQECKELKEKEKQEAKELKEKEREKAKQEAKEQKEKEKREAKELKEKEYRETHPCPGKNQVQYTGEYGKYCETEEEHAEWQSFVNCPLHEPPVGEGEEETTACTWGRSAYSESAKELALTSYENATEVNEIIAHYQEQYGPKHSEFHAGNITVPLKLPITLRGGIEDTEVSQAFQWVGARGAETIEAVAQKGPSLTHAVDVAMLSQSEKERYEYFVENKVTSTSVTVELAGPATGLYLNEGNLLKGEGEAFGFPIKVKLSNPFLGDECYVGSNADPIQIKMSTGESGALHGKVGEVTSNETGEILNIVAGTLVDNTYEAPGVEGCGVNGGADAAINAALGLPSPAGQNTAVIFGELRQTSAEVLEEHGFS